MKVHCALIACITILAGVVSAKADWKVCGTNGFSQVSILNDSDRAASRDIVCRWTAFQDGRHWADGRFGLLVGRRHDQPLAPHEELVLPMPIVVAGIRQRGNEASLRVRFLERDGAGEEREIQALQIDCPRLRAARPLAASGGAVSFSESDGMLVFGVSGVTYRFCRKSGALCSVMTGCLFKHEWLKDRMRPEFSRIGEEASDRLKCIGAEVSAVTNDGERAMFSVVSRWRADCWAESDSALVAAQYWTVCGNGSLVCQGMFVWDGTPVGVATVGHRFVLIDDELLVDYYASGSAADGGLLGRYGVDSASCGRHANARSVSFDAGWDHLSVATCDIPFGFSVGAGHPIEFAAYRESPDSVRTDFAFVIRPEKAEGAVTVAPVELPAVELRSAAARKRVLGR